MSIANDIALAISARIATIKKVNGFSTDIGLKVMRGRKRLDPTMLPCAVLIERDDQVLDSRPGQVKVSQPFIIEGHAACDPDNPNDVGHQIIADIKKALFGEKFTYASGKQVVDVKYKGRSIAPREDGIEVVGAAVEVVVEFVEQLSNP